MKSLIACRSVSFAAIFFLLLIAVQRGQTLVCYQCNSEYDPRCGDPFDPYTLGTVNCSFQPRLEHLDFAEPTLCRKTSQKVYGKIRVVRSCGFVTDPRDDRECTMRSGTHDVFAVYCACTTDLCNGASTIRSTSSFAEFASVAFATTLTLAWRFIIGSEL